MTAPRAIIHHTSIAHVLTDIIKHAKIIIIIPGCSVLELSAVKKSITKVIAEITVLWQSANRLERIPDHVKDSMPTLESLSENCRRATLLLGDADHKQTTAITNKLFSQLNGVEKFFPLPGTENTEIPVLTEIPALSAVS